MSILENLYEHISMICFFKRAYDNFSKGKDFPDLHYGISVDTEEDAENIYELKASLAEADMIDEAKEAMYWLKKAHEFVEMHEKNVSKEVYGIWLKKFNEIMNVLENIVRGIMKKDDFDRIHAFCKMLRKIIKKNKSN